LRWKLCRRKTRQEETISAPGKTIFSEDYLPPGPPHENNQVPNASGSTVDQPRPQLTIPEEPTTLSEAFQRANIRKAIEFIKNGDSLMRGESLLLPQLFMHDRQIPPEALQKLICAIIECVDDPNTLEKTVDCLIENKVQIHTTHDLESPLFVAVRLHKIAALNVFRKALEDDRIDLDRNTDCPALLETLDTCGLHDSDFYVFLSKWQKG
jgi:hypothetical protein